MKRIVLVLATCVILATPVRADELLWAKALYVGLALADWSQTRYFQARQGERKDQFGPETNVLLPGDSPQAINLAIGAAIVGTLLLVEWLPAPWNERLLFVAIGIEFDVVRHNSAIGIRAMW